MKTKTFLAGIFLGILEVALATAQSPGQVSQTGALQPGTATPQTAPVTRIAPGSVIPVSLTKTIDAKKAKTGDEVIAKVTQDLKSNSGEIIIAKDTKVMGRVTEAQARSKEQKESQVAIAFDRAVGRDGHEMQLPMSIQAIIAPENSANNGGSDANPSGNNMPSTVGRGGMASPSAPSSTSDAGLNQPQKSPSNSRPPITGQTQGVIGMDNLTLNSAPTPAAQGSVVSSEKNNVKLESGTLLLLRVNQ